MIAAIFIFCVSLVLMLALTPGVRAAARRAGLVDRPDGHRKIHARIVPVAGGIALWIAGAASLATLAVWPAGEGVRYLPAAGLLAGSLLITALGVVDDWRGLRGRHKFLGQLVAVCLIIASGLQVDSIELFGRQWHLGAYGAGLAAFWLLGAINSLNLLDGMDGLLTTASLVMSAALGCLAAIDGDVAGACLAAALAGGLAGFLRYNFPPASIFLGDSGSMLIGLMIGVLSLRCASPQPGTVNVLVPLAVLIIPVLDTAAAIIRRKLTGRSIYAADRGHLHHCLLTRGLSNRQVLAAVAGLGALAGVGAIVARMARFDGFAAIAAGLVIGILLWRGWFGHAELRLIGERARALAARLLERGSRAGRHMQVRLQGSIDWASVWEQFKEHAVELELTRLVLDVNAPALHEGYHARWVRADRASETTVHWHAELPLLLAGQLVGRLEVRGWRGQESVWEKVALLAKLAENLEVARPIALIEPQPAATRGSAPPAADEPSLAAGQCGLETTLSGPAASVDAW